MTSEQLGVRDHHAMLLMAVLFQSDFKNWLPTHPEHQSHALLHSPEFSLNYQFQSLKQQYHASLQIAARCRTKTKGIGSDVILLHLQQPVFPTLSITGCDPPVDQRAVCNLGDTGKSQFSRAIRIKDQNPHILNFIRYQSE